MDTNSFNTDNGTNPNTISLDTTQPEQPISLDSGSTSYFLDPSQVKDRAFKASFGLEGTAAAQPQNILESAIGNSQEQDVRNQSATALNQDLQQQRQAKLTQALAYGALPEADMNKFFEQSKNDMFNPYSVFEVRFGQAYTGMLDTVSQEMDSNNIWNVAKNALFTDTDAMKKFGSITAAYHDYMLHRLQGTQSLIKNQSGGDFTADFLKMAFPLFNPYYDIKMRGNVDGVSFWNGLLGSNLEDQRMTLLRMPFNKGTQAFDQIMDRLEKDNPQAAAAFGASMLGQSTGDRNLNNINTIGNLADIPAVIKIATLPFKTSSVLNAARHAVQDQIIAKSISPKMTKADILASVGDLRASAVERAGDTVTAKIEGSLDPTKQALDELPRFLRSDEANIAKDPGNNTQNLTNTLLNDYRQSETGILRTLADILRPSRLPLADATRSVLDRISETTFERYPGMSNGIIHLSDPALEPLTNTYNVTGRVGKGAGQLFETEEEALNYARFHGLRLNLNDGQIGNIEARIADLKAQVKEGLAAHDLDTHGMNHYFNLEKQVKDLQDLRDNGRSPGAKVESVPGSKNNPNAARIKELKTQLADIDPQTADVHGLNRYNAIENELRSLEQNPATVGQQGLGYYIEVTKPLKETDSLIRDWIYSPDRVSSASPTSWKWVDFLLSKYRTAEDTFSPEQRAMRKSAVYPHGLLLRLAQQEWEHIKQVSGVRGKLFNRQEMADFKDTLQYAQDGGVDFGKPADLQHFYLTRYSRLPSDVEQRAYYAIRRWNEYDRILREVAVVRNKARLGAETHQVYLKDANGTKVSSAPFDGIARNDLPGSRAGNLLVLGDDAASSRVRNLSKINLNKKEADTFREMVKSGEYKLIQPYDYKEQPFKEMGIKDSDKTVDFVMVKGGNSETSPLTFKQVNRTFGGHWAYEYNQYAKEAIIKNETVDGIKTQRYLGDKPIAAVPDAITGRNFVDKLNAAKQLYREGKTTQLKAFVTKHFPSTADDLIKKFKTGAIDPNVDVHLVPRNSSVRDVDTALKQALQGNHFYDDTRRSLAKHYEVEFTGARDAENFHEVNAEGTTAEPVFNFRPAQRVDPIQIMSRGLGSIVRSTFMDDYKISAVETWLREASSLGIKTSFASENELRSSPYAFFKTVTKEAFENTVHPSDVSRMMGNRFKINQLLQMPTEWDSFLHKMATEVHDWSYNKLGPSKANALTPPWLISTLRDPFSFMRAITYSAYLGLYYLPQIIIQAWGLANTMAIAPRYAYAASYAVLLHGYASLTKHPEILSHLDKLAYSGLDGLATKLGMAVPLMPKWKPGWWTEAREMLSKTGFGLVGNEYSPIHQMTNPSVITSGTGKFLNAASWPARKGEQINRLGAWYSAFLEWREANPVGKIGRNDLEKILDKADFYYNNMSVASHSAAQNRLASLPAQFYTYIAHLGETFASNHRLGDTLAERNLARARIVGVNSALFGIPMGISASGLPISDMIRKEMMAPAAEDSPYNPIKYVRQLTGTDGPYSTSTATVQGGFSNWLTHFVMEGGPSTALAAVTGMNYNLGPRYGTQGWTPIRDALSGDNSFIKTIMGASGSLDMNWWHDKDGFVQTMASIYNKDGNFTPTANDFVDLFKVVQTVNKSWGLYVALNTKDWINRSGQTVMSDVSPLNAIFMTLAGLQPQEQADIYSAQQNMKDRQNQIDYATKKIESEWAYGVRAANKGDFDQAKQYMARAVGWTVVFNMNDDDVTKALTRAVRSTETNLIDSTAWRNLLKAPKGQEQQYQNLYGIINKYQRGQ